MKINYKWITTVSLSAILLLNPVTSNAITITTKDVLYETVSSQVLTSGVTYEEKSKLTQYGWVDIHVLKMDLNNEYVGLDILRSINGWGMRETLTTLSNTSPTVVGGVNASFFDMSKTYTDIIGTEYEDGYSSIKHNYNVGAMGAATLVETTANDMLIDFLGASLLLTNDDGKELHISGINTISDLTSPTVFNRKAYSSSKEIDSKARLYKIVVSGGVILEVAPPEITVDIPEDGYIVTLNESIAPYHLPNFFVGKYAFLTVNNTINREDIDLAVSGGGQILKAGQRVTTGMIIEPTKRNPRTAVGITADRDYLILMVVDGRGVSIGATHEELANYLMEYGVTDAMHFDGGGSSEMVARELGATQKTIMNTPSDGSQRKVINGLGIVSTAPQGQLLTLEIKTSASKVFVNMPIKFDIIGYDEYFNPVVIDKANLIMSNQGLTGNWSDTTFTPSTTGDGKITCQYNGISATTNITTIDTYIDLNIKPKALQIAAGQSGKFTLTGTDQKGFKGEINPSSVTWKVSDPSVGSFIDGVFVAKAQTGVTKVVAQANGREISAYVVVGAEKSILTSFEDTVLTTETFPETVMGTANLATEQIVDGQKAIRLDYHFASSVETQAVYAVLQNVTLNQKVQSLGLNILGDNSNLMVRSRLVDATGATFNITFAAKVDFTGWRYLEANVPSEAVYPVQVERIYAAALATDTPKDGTLYFDLFMQNKSFNTSQLKYDTEKILADPLISTGPQANDFVISVFGTTAGRNRLLDDVVLQKVYDRMNASSLALFAGLSSISKSKVTIPSLIWDNRFTVNDYDNVRIINLATNSGGLVATNADQWRLVSSTLANTVQNNIIIVGNINANDFEDEREGALLQSILSTYQQKTNKNIFYLNASGYKFDVDLNSGIRYIDLNGLWYSVTSDKKVDLTNSFNMLEFYIHGDSMNYAIKNLYPKIEIGQ